VNKGDWRGLSIDNCRESLHKEVVEALIGYLPPGE